MRRLLSAFTLVELPVVSRRKAAGFTLVELLVVIGIIALLISILLPSLNRAREASKRVVCLSNMRELSNGLRIYAAENKDVCPIGFVQQKAFSYIMNWCNKNSDPPKPSQMGLLVMTNVVKNPKAFFCPSEADHKEFSYQPNPKGGYSDNPWPFATTAPPPGTTWHTNLGFSARPAACWPWQLAAGGISVPQNDPRFWLPSDGKGNISLPRFARLKNVAILADTCFARSLILSRHKSGINVLYAHGGAKWVPMTPKTFDKLPWKNFTEDTAFSLIEPLSGELTNEIFLNDGTFPEWFSAGDPLPRSKWTGFWVDLDRQSS